MRDEYNLIVMPKLVKWFRKDFLQATQNTINNLAAALDISEEDHHSSINDEKVRLLRALDLL